MIVPRSSAHWTRGKLPILSALFILLVASTGPIVCAREQLPVAKIVSVEAPTRVSPEEDFIVLVTVDYSGSYSTDIAVIDTATGFVLASKGLIIPAGRNVFTFSLTARDLPGVWTLTATVRVWWHNGWYANQNEGAFPFQITIPDITPATLGISSNLASFEVKVDGITHVVPSGGIELSTAPGFHRIEAEPLVDLDDGTRAVFDRWSDGVGSSVRDIHVLGERDLVAIYLTEFLLKVESSVGETVGSGWYPAGANATFGVLDPGMVEHSPMDSEGAYVFSHWSGDSDSTSVVSWVMMDRPKVVAANWSEDVSQATVAYQLVTASLAFFSCSVMLVAVGVTLGRRARPRIGCAIPARRTVSGRLLMLMLLMAVAHSQMAQPTNALILLQPESVMIGDAVWYHWNQTASDTLLLWLGGGIVGQTGFLVNPYEFESYNTMRFIQDLARYYNVLALEKGSVQIVDPTINKTVFCEPYPSSRNFVEKIRIWAGQQGYRYLYVVGYSVGAMVAATELVLANPAKWTSPNGLIIITTKIPQKVCSKAASLRASLLLLYGDKIAPEFIESGEGFFHGAPEDGWRDGFWYHKEYHVIPDVEHEVWTIRDSGEYDSRAVLLTIRFIEKSKGLQFERFSQSISRIVLNLTASTESDSPFDLEIASVDSPSKVRTGEAFRITDTVRYDLSSNFTVAVVAFDKGSASIVSASERQACGRGEAQFVTTLLSGDNARTLSFSLIPLVAAEDGWKIVAGGIRLVIIDVTDSFAVTVIVGYPNVPVEFDGKTIRTSSKGEVTLNATPGEHVVSVPSVVMLGNTSRAVFDRWDDSRTSPTLRLATASDATLLAIYRRQHHLSVTSPHGQTTGTEWYDENAIARFHVAPPLLVEQTAHVFTGWSGDSIDSSPSSSVFMNSSKNIEASWKDLEPRTRNENLLPVQALFIVSLVIALSSLVFVAMSLRSRRRSVLADAPSRSS